MKSKKIMACSVLLAIPFLYSTTSFAVNKNASNFEIKLFNNITVNQPLHYSVSSHGQPPIEDMLPVGDDNGKLISISGSGAKPDAEVVLKDTTGRVLWDGTVSFYNEATEFYVKTTYLDSHYNLGTNSFPTAHIITFDIHDQSK